MPFGKFRPVPTIVSRTSDRNWFLDTDDFGPEARPAAFDPLAAASLPARRPRLV
jgi:hypothetical protein